MCRNYFNKYFSLQINEIIRKNNTDFMDNFLQIRKK